MDLERVGNWIEASLWFVVTVTLLFKAAQESGRMRVVFALLALAFALFGVTDLIESETGAWWRPLWLLAAKSACVVGFVVGFTAYYKLTRNNTTETEKSESNSGPSC